MIGATSARSSNPRPLTTLEAKTARCLGQGTKLSSLPAFLQSLAHALESERQVLEDCYGFEPKHPVTQPSELAIAARICGAALTVLRPIHFHHEHRARRQGVDDGTADNHLPAKRDAKLPAAKGDPKACAGPDG